MKTVPSMDGAENAAVTIRDATESDMSAIQAIYAHAVLHGLASFEETPPTVGEMLARRAAERGGRIVGYAYATAYRPRPAYRFTIEDSVYVAEDTQGEGIGRMLLAALIEKCEAGPWRQMVAVIGDSGNLGSIALHESLGFRMVGTLEATGFKLGRWVDTVLMQRALGEGAATAPNSSK
jgi:L-amino acid N-acyltransferase YncA